MANGIRVRNSKQLGVAVRRSRRQNKLTQTEVAERAGLRQASVSQFERGQKVRLDTLFKILAALDLDLFVQDREK